MAFSGWKGSIALSNAKETMGLKMYTSTRVLYGEAEASNGNSRMVLPRARAWQLNK